MSTRPGDVVTFYAYKGGVGRTFALADTAVRLARWGYRVLAVDWDLEAPGLHEYLRVAPGPGVVDLVEQLARTDVSAGSYVRPFHVGGASVDVLTAGTLDKAYARQVAAIDWGRLYAGQFGRRLERLRSAWKATYDIVLLDSRTGLSDSGGVSTIHLPDIVVALFTANRQSVAGAHDAVLRAREAQADLPIGRARLMVVPVQTRVDFSEYEAQKHWRELILERFRGLVEEWAWEVDAGEVLDALAVPYVPFWSYGERLPALESAPASKLDVGSAHENLSALLARHLEAPDELVRHRHRYLAAAPKRAQVEAPPPSRPVFLLYSLEDLEFARKLGSGLVDEGVPVLNLPPEDRAAIASFELPEEDADYVLVLGSNPGVPQRHAVDELTRRLEETFAMESVALVREWRVLRVVRTGSTASWLPPALQSAPAVLEARSGERVGAEVVRLLQA